MNWPLYGWAGLSEQGRPCALYR